MNILYIGGGFVGTCSAAVSADSGHNTLVYDIDPIRIQKLSSGNREAIQSCLHEEGLSELLIRNNERITFTNTLSDVEKFVHGVDVVFMCLPTPEKHGAAGETDLSYYEQAVKDLGPLLSRRNGGAQEKRLVIVNKSTVPIQMIDYTEKLFTEQGVKNFGIVSNPEFLVEGKAIKDSIHPDRVVVGAHTPEDFQIMREIYQRFYDSSTVAYIEVNPYEAACGKLLANFLLFNKVVTTYDVVGRTCEYFDNVNYESVRKILITDPRIGSWGLYNSLYAGGSCFIKDAASLANQLEQAGSHAHLIREILDANTFQCNHFFSRAETDAGVQWAGKRVGMLGVAFKQSTNDIRNSGAINIIHELLGTGVGEIKVYDPAALGEAKKYFNPEKNELYQKIAYVNNASEAIADIDVCIIATDWPQFRGIGDQLLSLKNRPLIMDGRRILQHQYTDLVAAGFSVIAVGSPFFSQSKSH